MTQNKAYPTINFWKFLIISTLWYGYAYFTSKNLVHQSFGLVFLNVIIFATPIALSGAYSLVINQARTVSFYNTDGWTYWFFSRRFLKAFIWLTWSIISAFLMLIFFVSCTSAQWLALAGLISVYWWIHFKNRSFLRTELKKHYVLTNYSITWSKWTSLIVYLPLYLILLNYLDDTSASKSLQETITQQQKIVSGFNSSFIVQIAVEISAFKDGFQIWIIQHFGEFGKIWPLLLNTIAGTIIFFNTTLTLSAFVINKTEYRRIFAPITDDDIPSPLSKQTIAFASATITFILLFIFLPLTATLEKSLYDHPEMFESIKRVENQLIASVEKIDGELYTQGTIKKIEAINALSFEKFNVSKALLENNIDNAYNQMESNVDSYLDWYYSLKAEYLRLAKLMMGTIENDMKIELEKKLTKGEVTKTLSDGLNQLIADNKVIKTESELSIKKILADNHLPDTGTPVNIVKNMSLNEMFTIPDMLGITDFKNRLLTDGLIATGISAIIIKKVLSKGTFKVAAKALSKIAVKKSISTGTGTAVGAVIGSLIPGAGTIVGGTVGGIVTGLFLDTALLSLEELTDREKFKQTIIDSIRESKAEFKDKLFNNKLPKTQENKDLIIKAEQGDIEAQIKIGFKYENGEDIEQNIEEALKWYKKAADQGSSNAKVNIGNLYRNGNGVGVPQSDKDALHWYQKAADQGNADGQNLLGIMYFNGTGIDKDNNQALSWFHKSADQGNSDAQVNLGVMYQKGVGGEKNDEKAISWFKKSAEQGNSSAQVNLGAMYQYGYGVEKNTKEACALFKKSADQGNTDAQVGLAVCYQSGDGIEKNDELADFWYKEAATIKNDDNMRLINTTSYLTNLNKFVTSVGTDEYVIVKSTKVENFTRESGKHINTPFGPISTSHSTIKANVEANYSYHVNLTTLKYSMENEILVFNVPKLFLSKPVAENTAAYNYKCRTTILKQDVPYDDLSPDCTKAGNLLHTELSNELEATGETNKANVYTDAATSLAHNFDSFAKNNDKGIYYRKISVIFDDEIGKPRREFEINKSYCGDEPCKLEVPVGNGQILTIK